MKWTIERLYTPGTISLNLERLLVEVMGKIVLSSGTTTQEEVFHLINRDQPHLHAFHARMNTMEIHSGYTAEGTTTVYARIYCNSKAWNTGEKD